MSVTTSFGRVNDDGSIYVEITMRTDCEEWDEFQGSRSLQRAVGHALDSLRTQLNGSAASELRGRNGEAAGNTDEAAA